jgi:hypothetical protein
MSNGMRSWDAQGIEIFNSPTDLTLFPKTEQFISGNSQVGPGGMSIAYPQFQGKKIMAFMTSPYGEYFVDNMANWGNAPIPQVLSCRVVYSNGTPIVQLFSDGSKDGLTGQNVPIYDGYLVVMLTGANQ